MFKSVKISATTKRGKPALGTAMVLAGTVATGAALGAQTGSGNAFSLSLTGAPTVHVSGICEVTNGAEVEKHEIDQSLPFALTFHGASLRCRISADGEMDIEARSANGNRTRSRTSGGTMTINLGERS